jgi:small subunit ribosomal protein S16
MAAEKESPRDGRFLEILGSYNPRTNPSTVVVNEERVYDWMSKGAQPSDSVIQIFNSVGLMDRFARFKAGESKESLLIEAKAAYEKHAASGKVEKPVVEEKKASAKKPAKVKEAKKVEEVPSIELNETLPLIESAPVMETAEAAPGETIPEAPAAEEETESSPAEEKVE